MSQHRSAPSASMGFVLSQVGWFACVLGAAQGWLLAGPLFVGCLVVFHLRYHPSPRRFLLGLGVVALVGVVVDALAITGGALVFPTAVRGLAPDFMAPAWMVALWVGFGTTLGGVMRPLGARPVIAAMVGFVAGPVAYRGGAALGAAELGLPLWRSMVVLGALWAVALPLLLRVDAHLHPEQREESHNGR